MGNYPTPPSRRWATDRDNTQVTCWRSDKENITVLTGAEINKLNDEDNDYFDVVMGLGQLPDTEFAYLCFIFPEARKLSDVKIIGDTSPAGRFGTFTVEYSDDTTTGRDGTWASVASGLVVDETLVCRPNYRQSIQAAAAAAPHIAYRLKFSFSAGVTNAYVVAAHLYGLEYGAADRLAFTDVAGTALPADEDFEEVARGASSEKTFYVKNLSATKTAHTITVTVEQGPSYGNASSWTLLSLDQISYAQSKVIGDLAPGQVSDPIYFKCAPPVGSEVGTLSCRVTPSVVSWS